MSRVVTALLAASLASVLAACGSSTQTVTAPSTSKCGVSATADASSFGAAGGSGNITVSTNRECQWTAQSTTSWVSLASGSSGQGEGKVTFNVAKNTDPSARRGAVSVNDQQVTISEEAAPCQFTVSPVADTVSSGGDRRTLTVTASSGQCAWTARSNSNWIAIANGAQGTGNGTVTYDAQPTTGPTRSGSLTVADQTITITQGTGCSVAISPTGSAMGAAGGAGTITVTTGSGCAWSAAASDPWISITSGATGAGSGTITFNVSGWNGPARTATITVNGQVFTITQGAGCSFSLNTSSASVPAGGGSGSVQVITAGGCTWLSSSNASWISITSGASGSGAGTVQFSAAPNSGPARTGTITIGSQVFTIDQGDGCAFSITPASQSFSSGGGSGSFNVSAGNACSWSASASQSWVHFTAGLSGTGNGTVPFTVDPNPGSARDATITAAGQTFSIHQNAGCSYSLSATTVTIPAAGGTGSVSVSAGSACTWSASAPDPWARITAGTSGTGNGTVQFIVDPNPGASRTSTLTIAGIAFTIVQDPVTPCTFSVSPAAANYADAVAHTGSFALTASAANCTWAATVSDPWIQITSAISGTGSATIDYSVFANAGAARTGTISVGGQVFTITQASGCAISIAPASQTVAAAGGGGSIAVSASDPACGWAATPDVPWITITAGATGAGNGTVTFAVAANSSGAARTGHIDVAGQTFTVSQN